MNKKFDKYSIKEEEFFEGFKTPQSYLMIGNLDVNILNMNDCNSNLLIISKDESEDLIRKIVNHFEYINEDDNLPSLITKTESDNYVMLMTFCDISNNTGLHELVSLKDSIQLLDDATSTNDCLRALEYLNSLKDDFTTQDYIEIENLIKSQLSEKGVNYIKEFAPELLEEEIKVKKLKP